MKFLTERDIKEAVGQGMTEILLDGDTRATDLAREAAQRLGVRLCGPGDASARPAYSRLHQQVRAAIISQLGMTPDGLDAIIDRVLKAVGGND